MFVYAGTFSRDGSSALHTLRFAPETGRLSHVSTATDVINPSFLALSSDKRRLYAVSEVNEFGGQHAGALGCFATQKDGSLHLLEILSTQAPGPCHVTINSTDTWILVSNYRGESITLFPAGEGRGLQPAAECLYFEGSSVHPTRQTRSHPHSCVFDDTRNLAIAADLGTDQLMIFRTDGKNQPLQPFSPKYVKVQPGSGPRHMALHPSKMYLYVVNELNNTVSVLIFDESTSALAEVQNVSTLPEKFTGANITADIHVSDDGRFLFVSNRGHDSIAVFSIDESTGRLSVIEHASCLGMWPRNFAIVPGAGFLLVANQRSSSVVSFALDRQSGKLEPIDRIAVQDPVCVVCGDVMGTEGSP